MPQAEGASAQRSLDSFISSPARIREGSVTPQETFEKIIQSAKENMDRGDAAALALSPVPLVGDAAGVLNDVRNFVTGREEATPGNVVMSVLGVIPGIPSVSDVKRIVRPAGLGKGSKYVEWEKEFLKNNPEVDRNNIPPEGKIAAEKATRAWRGSDGIIREELDDSSLRMRTDHLFKQDQFGVVPGTRSSIMGGSADVSDYMKGWTPEMLQMKLEQVKTHTIPAADVAAGTRGQRFSNGAGKSSVGVRSIEADEFPGVMKHELQHEIQEKYGMEGGGSPDEFFLPGSSVDEQNLAYRRYLALDGEVEARVVQQRSELSQPEREMRTFNEDIEAELKRRGIVLTRRGDEARALPKFGTVPPATKGK